jgi:phosphate transport system permease protein
MRRLSALAGGFALALIMVPIVLRTTEEMIRWCPTFREAGLGSASRSGRWTRIVLLAARQGSSPA